MKKLLAIFVTVIVEKIVGKLLERGREDDDDERG